MEHPLTRAEAEKLIRRIAQNPTGVGLRSHCRDRMRQWGLDALDIQRILRNAVVQVPAYKRNNEWRYRVAERPGNAPEARRNVQAVVVILTEDGLQVHTVYRKREG
jgi:hypothetical protein